jgi:hypothetical protein
VPWLRALLVWIVIIVVESIHGAVRVLFIAPTLGDLRSRQLGVPIGALLIFAIALAFSHWLGARTVRQQLCVGAFWAGLTAAFEVVLGRFAFGFGWDRILADYDLTRGGLMGFGLLAMLLIPYAAARMRSGTQRR